MKINLKKIGKNALALGFGLVVAFVLVEIILRIFQPFDFRVKGDKIVLPANQRFVMRNESIAQLDDTIFHSKNRLGFRGDAPPDDWDAALTVITVGGSTTECYYLSDGKTWQDEINRCLSPTFPNFWINNAGLDGHSTFGHQVLLEDYIVPLKPDYVLFLIGINDVATADFESFDRLMLKKTNTSSVGGFLKSLANRSETLGLAFNFYRYYVAYKQGLMHSKTDFKNLPTVEVSATERAKILEKHQKEFLENYQKRVKKLVKTCQNANIKPIFITQPQIVGDTIDAQTGVDLGKIACQSVNGSVCWEILQAYNDVTRNVGQSLGVPVIDLAVRLPKQSRYFYDLTHYTNEGAFLTGKIISEELKLLFKQKKISY